MFLTTKARYAIMSMIDLFNNKETGKPISLHEISERQDITVSYLEQIFWNLKNGQLVKSSKGPNGGYLLAKNNINLLEIIEAVDENIKLTRCKNGNGCMKNNIKCQAHEIWEGLQNSISDYFESINLADIVNGKLKL